MGNKMPRQCKRFWPFPGLSAAFTPADQPEHSFHSKRVWDISNQNCAIEFEENISLGKQTKGSLSFTDSNNANFTGKKLQATVERCWGNGLALSFPETDMSAGTAFEKRVGDSHSPVAHRKRSIALEEINDISAEIRSTKDCQINLFVSCYTIATGLFALLGVIHEWQPSANFLMFLVCVAIAWVTAAFSMLILHKVDTLNQLESFSLLLKQQLDQGCFYPGYRGWDDARVIYQNCKKTKCNERKRCREAANDYVDSISFSRRVNCQSARSAAMIVGSFSIIFFSAVALAVYFFVNDHGSVPALLATGGVSAIIMLGALAYVLKGIWQTRLGSKSFIKYFTVWDLIMSHCIPFHPERLKDKE